MFNIKSRAPLRIGISGGGTDIEFFSKKSAGCVINGTINLYSSCVIKLTNKKYHSFTSLNNNQNVRIFKDSDMNLKHDSQLNLIIGVYKYFVKNFSIKISEKIDIQTYLDVPGGSGLGSSSAIIVSIIEGLKKTFNVNIDKYETSELAISIERGYLKIPGGKQDQYASVFGGINYIDFEKDGKVIVNQLNLDGNIIHELENNLILYYTGINRKKHEVIEQQIQNIKYLNKKTLDSLQKIKSECIEMKKILLTNELNLIPKRFIDSWAYKKKMSENVSDFTAENILNRSLKNGALAGKWSGAGGGGFMIFYTNFYNKKKLVDYLSNFEGGKIYNFSFINKGSESWISKE